ncbi:MAG: hypothetical protein Q8P40_08575 [Nitrospirota bacterium]|nr:hypothetical protein [Nitrospirota bacterium]
MVFADWTVGGLDGAEGVEVVLDAATKYAGNSSVRFRVRNTYHSKLTHNTFSKTQTQLILWVYTNVTTHQNISANLASYGSRLMTVASNTTWEKHRVSFWYDTTTNTKWGRDERWVASAWVQIGTDTNFGSGSPAASALSLRTDGIVVGSSNNYTWFDEVEVYS